MNRLIFGFLAMMIICCLAGCAGMEAVGTESASGVGLRETELIAQKGQPQQILPDPSGGKILVYQNYRLDQTAGMRGGVWSKPEQVHYWLDSQGVVTKVEYYPYGKRKFLFPSEKEPAALAQVPAQPSEKGAAAPLTTAPAPPRGQASVSAPSAPPKEVAQIPAPTIPSQRVQQTPAASAPREVARVPVAAPTPPAKAAPPADMEAATRLELHMTKEAVRRLLGVPDRTEGYRMGGKNIIIWFYSLRDKQDRRVSTPLVFEDGSLSGWGDSYYLRLPKGKPGQNP